MLGKGGRHDPLVRGIPHFNKYPSIARQRCAVSIDVRGECVCACVKSVHILHGVDTSRIRRCFVDFQRVVRQILFAGVNRNGLIRGIFNVINVPVRIGAGKARIYNIVCNRLQNTGFFHQLICRVILRVVPFIQFKELRRAVRIRHYARSLPPVIKLIGVATILNIRDLGGILLVFKAVFFKQITVARAPVDFFHTFLRGAVIADFGACAVNALDFG